MLVFNNLFYSVDLRHILIIIILFAMGMHWGTRLDIAFIHASMYQIGAIQKIALVRHDRRWELYIFSIINSIWNCTTMQFDALKPLLFSWIIHNLLRILFSENRWISNSFIQLEHMNHSVTHLHLLIFLSRMASPVGNYLHYLILYINWKEFLSMLINA